MSADNINDCINKIYPISLRYLMRKFIIYRHQNERLNEEINDLKHFIAILTIKNYYLFDTDTKIQHIREKIKALNDELSRLEFEKLKI